MNAREVICVLLASGLIVMVMKMTRRMPTVV